jgi:hypothetical protein
VASRVWFCGARWAAAGMVRSAAAHRAVRRLEFAGMDFIYHKVLSQACVLPDGPAALCHPTNEDLFVGAPVQAATSWRVYLVFVMRVGWSFRWSEESDCADACSSCDCERW